MTSDEFTEKYSLDLNRQQLDAVELSGCPVLLLAVPGSGKTTVLISRIGYMIHCLGVQPENILAVTYTRAAAADMRQRYFSFFGEKDAQNENELRTADFLTINGLCHRILEHYSRTIKPNPFTMFEDGRQKNELLREIFAKYTGDRPTDSDISELAGKISYFKNMMSDREEMKKSDKPNRPFSTMFAAYDGWMKQNRRMDYDDQMRFSLMIMKKYPQIPDHFRKKYRYICVDEAQDTSKLQHAVISLLAESGKTLFMVGDEDQSIYGFRAAYPEALVNFERDYPGARVLLLEENYRSNALIVEAADRFISRNVSRHPKKMCAARSAGRRINEIKLPDRSAQYPYLMKIAADCRKRTAVLYRDNESGLPLIDLLEREGIPYSVRAADLNFFTGRIVRDITDFLRLAEDPGNTEIFLRAYYKMKLYISKSAALAACEAVSHGGGDIWETLIAGRSDERMKSRLSDARENLKSLLTDSAGQAMDRISDDLNYRGYLEEKDIPTGSLSTLKAIAGREKSLSSLLKRLEKLREIISGKKSDPSCPFILSTIHSSKGLEYDTVYLMDVFEGVLPADDSARSKPAGSPEFREHEEERRLFYVAVTRARDELNIFSVRFMYSPFTEEIMGRMVPQMPEKEKQAQTDQPKPAFRKKPFDPAEYEAFRSRLSPGRKVEHHKFGEGTVVSLEGSFLTAAFGKNGGRTLSVEVIFSDSRFRVL